MELNARLRASGKLTMKAETVACAARLLNLI